MNKSKIKYLCGVAFDVLNIHLPEDISKLIYDFEPNIHIEKMYKKYAIHMHLEEMTYNKKILYICSHEDIYVHIHISFIKFNWDLYFADSNITTPFNPIVTCCGCNKIPSYIVFSQPNYYWHKNSSIVYGCGKCYRDNYMTIEYVVDSLTFIIVCKNKREQNFLDLCIT